jgi:CRISPR-associated endonuclease/helicase Cas3
MNLCAKQFRDYFLACHGKEPFPWQARLVASVIADGWNAVNTTLSLPTASGKTAILDVAVFALACEAAAGAAPRRMPRRIALVVDRRIVVDDAYRRACHIRDSLLQAREGILFEVAQALRTLGGELPLDAAQLRGGIYREDRWARTPVQPVILCSTVDQVGSRLLHRAYGVSPSLWPIHGGLLGNDALIVLDEAHCSEPFRQTLDWVERYRAKAENPLALPFHVVTMTATPRSDRVPFALSPDDYLSMKRRLEARKPATLCACGKKDADFVQAMVDQADKFIRTGATLLVVVNRVAQARQICEKIRKDHRAQAKKTEVILLTGRCRPIERDAVLQRWRDRLMAGRDRSASAEASPLVVVATQCVEVGADLDVDALVTECASLDALRQRFGRMNRLGEAPGETPASIVIRADQAEKDADDPIYGKALSQTWQWLCDRKGVTTSTVDLGIIAVDGGPDAPGVLPHDPAERANMLAPLIAPIADAPIVLPAYCDLWSQTGPEPAVSPEPAIFLHGPHAGAPEVRVVWRADLGADPATWSDTVSICPPVSGEALPLPLWLVRQWLAGEGEKDQGADTESAPAPKAAKDERLAVACSFRPALRWQGPERSLLADKSSAILPGDTLVVPARYGGCDEFGWNPSPGQGDGRVPDLAHRARLAARRCAVLRLHPNLPLPESLAPYGKLCDTAWPEETDELRAGLRGALAAVPLETPDFGPLCRLLLAAEADMEIDSHPSGTGLVLSCERRPAVDGGPNATEFSDEDNAAAHAARAVTLRQHLNDVGEQARSMLRASGLSASVAHDVALAAQWHDLGKADPRFQAWLAGGNRAQAVRHGLLAKSARMPKDAAKLRAAREAAGYPEGGRHELLSVRLLEAAPELLARAHDRDLVLHLIESHHGHCRPFAPVVFDAKPVAVRVPSELAGVALGFEGATRLERLDSGVAERFWRLIRRYGWWGLSYLETCMRLADHRASEQEGRA